MKKLYSIIACLCISYSSFAQPSINASNFNPVVGESFTFHTFTPASLTPGSSGANQTWNFAATPIQGTTSFTYVTPSSTPYASTFPAANIAFNQNGVYGYEIVNSNYYARSGAWANGVAMPYSNEEKFLTYPFTYNNTFTDQWAASFTSSGYLFNRSGSVTVTADGYGTLTLPWGTVTNVLRLHYTETYQDVYQFGTINYTSDNYGWIKPGTHYFLYQINSITTSGTTNYYGMYLDQNSVGISEANANEIGLTMYPNPSAVTLDVNFDLNSNDAVTYSVLNTLGQIVYQENVSSFAGRAHQAIDVSSFTDGLYFLNIQIGANRYSKRFVVQR